MISGLGEPAPHADSMDRRTGSTGSTLGMEPGRESSSTFDLCGLDEAFHHRNAAMLAHCASEAVEYPATARSQDHYQPTRVGGDSPHGSRRLRGAVFYICAKRRLPDRGHRPRKDSVSSRLIADESLRDSGFGWISPKSTSKAALEPEVVKRHISIERPAGYGRKPATRKSVD